MRELYIMSGWKLFENYKCRVTKMLSFKLRMHAVTLPWLLQSQWNELYLRFCPKCPAQRPMGCTITMVFTGRTAAEPMGHVLSVIPTGRTL